MITLTNPEAYPQSDSFRESVVELAHHLYNIMSAIEDDETLTRDDVCTQLAVDEIRAADVAIAVMQVAPDTFTFYTVKGAHLIRAVMAGKLEPFKLVSFPIFRPEDAAALRDLCGDGAEDCDEPKKKAPITGPRPCTVSLPKDQLAKLVDSANDLSRAMLGMDRAAAQEYVKHQAAQTNVVVAIYPDPDAPPDHGGLSFAVIKGLRQFEAATRTDTQIKIMALALSDEQQVITAERNIGDSRPLN